MRTILFLIGLVLTIYFSVQLFGPNGSTWTLMEAQKNVTIAEQEYEEAKAARIEAEKELELALAEEKLGEVSH